MKEDVATVEVSCEISFAKQRDLISIALDQNNAT